MVKNTFSQRLRGSSESSLPQDILAIFLSDQRLQYVVADHLGQPHLLKEYESISKIKETDLLNATFSEDVDIRKTYSQSYLILKSPVALLEPINMDAGNASMTQFLLPVSSITKRRSDNIDANGIKVTYPFKDTMGSFVEQMFTNLSILHHHTVMIQIFDDLSDNTSPKVYAHFEDENMSIFFYKDAKLQYANQFKVQSDEDRIYYVMLIYKQFDLDPSREKLSVSLGSGIPHSSTIQLRSYVQSVEVLEYQPISAPSEAIYQDSMAYRQFYFILSSLSVLANHNRN